MTVECDQNISLSIAISSQILMAAPLLPPPNAAGVPLPPPVVFADIAPAIDYVRQLNDGRIGTSLKLGGQ